MSSIAIILSLMALQTICVYAFWNGFMVTFSDTINHIGIAQAISVTFFIVLFKDTGDNKLSTLYAEKAVFLVGLGILYLFV